ncbi:MAG TPA: helix-turn-helix transcriptional regulator [Micromonospora sp.]
MGLERATASPAAARRRLRLALRAAREARRLTRGQVAAALDWSVSKLNRIENGDVTVSTTDLRALLELYQVTDPQRVGELVADARASRRRGWWDEPRFRDHLTPALLELLQLESEARVIRHFHPTLIAGLLQTRAYAEMIMQAWARELPAAQRAARLEARMCRAARVFARPEPPRFYFVMDESVLWRLIGGPRVMAEQLYHLLELTARPGIALRVVPLAEAAITAMAGPFALLDIDGDEENTVLYREEFLVDEIVESRETLRRYRRHFDRMWAAALNEEDSAQLIRARADALLRDARSGVDRYGGRWPLDAPSTRVVAAPGPLTSA